MSISTNTLNSLIDDARKIISENDRGSYTVPTHGLYPFQWNWDSCLTAIGLAHYDEHRAWQEIQTLFSHQWRDGMVPHIIFHEPDEGYYPGPDVWQTSRSVPTSGITQPPVAGFAARIIYERAKDREMAQDSIKQLLPLIHSWHHWFFQNRDPDNTGLVSIIHPWESGRDNSLDWETALSRIETPDVGDFTRRDTDHANPDHRPTQWEYDRYIQLILNFRALEWDNSILHDASEFSVIDPGFNAILFRSCLDLAWLADELGESDISSQSQSFGERGLKSLETLWSDSHNQYLCYDRKSDELIDSPSISGLLPVFAPIPLSRCESIASRITTLGQNVDYLIPVHDPSNPKFDGRRYWRGPVWLIINYLISDGLLHRFGNDNPLAARIFNDSIRLIINSGFCEYYDPMNGTGCGGSRFTWTAAMVIEFLQSDKVEL